VTGTIEHVSETVERERHPLVRARLGAEQRWDAGLAQLLVIELPARWIAAQRYEAAARLAGPVVGDPQLLDHEAAEIGAALGLGPWAGAAFVADARVLQHRPGGDVAGVAGRADQRRARPGHRPRGRRRGGWTGPGSSAGRPGGSSWPGS